MCLTFQPNLDSHPKIEFESKEAECLYTFFSIFLNLRFLNLSNTEAPHTTLKPQPSRL